MTSEQLPETMKKSVGTISQKQTILKGPQTELLAQKKKESA